jgi:hypothetical protein
VNTLMRSIGTATAAAVAGVLLTQLTVPFGAVSVPTREAFQLVMAIAAVACAIALGVAAFLPGRAAVAGKEREHAVVP